MNFKKNQIAEISLKKSAIIAGVGLLLMAIIAPIANFTIIQGLVDPKDVTKTISNIIASDRLFRLGIVLLMTVALLDIIVAWALYIFLVPINKQLSDGLGKLLSTDYNLTISMFTFIGEAVLMFWLLIKGRQIEEKIKINNSATRNKINAGCSIGLIRI